ncbi:MFS transporter [Umezawaea tangerina]|uniref:Transmembrane secretion effector n=1 Tax=Umezawaea tangerina TaxID=84725 RepID=A0A2T0SP13_9PSEU|nr:MFS transporter [Umezawaea tangerina]PRY35148.1 transmembrane secretion effector [Umezawaea tangerina]
MPTTQAGNPLRRPAFRWFFLGRSVSLLGGSMTSVALAFAVLQASGRAGDLAVVLAAATVPLVLFVLVGGSVADRFSKGRLLTLSNLGAGVTQGAVAVVLLAGAYDLRLVVVLEFLNGTLTAFTTPALRGVLPELVGLDEVQRANSLLSAVRYGARILGPPVAGLLVVAAGGGWAIAVDALSFVLAGLCMARLDLPAKVARGQSLLRDMRDGWQEFRATTWVWSIVAVFSLANMVAVGVWAVLGPTIALRTVGQSSWGLVLGVEALGVLVMAAAMYRLVLPRLMLAGQLAIVVGGLPMVVLGLGAGVPWLAGAAFAAGLGSGLFGIAWETSLQEHVPAHLLSRITSYDDFGSYVAIPIGQLGVVPLALVFGDTRVALVGGVVFSVLVLLPLASASVRGLRHG